MPASHWTNVYGYARSILAVGTALTLLLNHSDTLFASVPATGLIGPQCSGIGAVGIFCLVSRRYLEVARFVAVICLLVVASGWRPRYTGVLHWWFSLGLFGAGTIIDGGDQIASVLTLLLIPMTLTDNRQFHWDPPGPATNMQRTVAGTSMVLVRVQVSVVYLHAFVAKMFVEEWADGTAIYYWLNDHRFGVPAWASFVLPVLQNGVVVVVATWGTIAVEALLFMGLLAAKRHRAWLLHLGMTFHGAIAVMMGLVSFSLAMTAALILYLRDPVDTFRDWRRMSAAQAVSRLAVRASKFVHGNVICRLFATGY